MKKKKQAWPDTLGYYSELINKFKIKRADMALFLFFILVSLFSTANMHFIIGFSEGTGSVVVQNNGKRSVLALDSDKLINLGGDKDVCELKISDGQAWITKSNCPKNICVKTGAIEKPGQSIICLHHGIVIEIKGESDVDTSIR